MESLEKRTQAYSYGRRGSPTLQAAFRRHQSSRGRRRLCSCVVRFFCGHAALMSVLDSGDHVLVTDNAYGPTRTFCDKILTRFGIETTYYEPTIGAGIADLIRPNTRAVFCESPGSLTFEVQDIPAIAAVAHKHQAFVIADNTWATPLLFDAFAHGVDINLHAATKYNRRPLRRDARCGHSEQRDLEAAARHALAILACTLDLTTSISASAG